MDFLNDLGENRYMKRIKLTVAYDGTAYCGWQVQPNGVTIEEILNREISGLTGEEIRVIGASRTDSGVHALGNVAVIDTKSPIPPERFSYAYQSPFRQVFDKLFCHPTDHTRKALIFVGFLYPKCVDRRGF